MNTRQRTALRHPCLLAVEFTHPRFSWTQGGTKRVLAVNAGYECIERDYDGPVWHASVTVLEHVLLEAKEQGKDVEQEFIELAKRALKWMLHGVGKQGDEDTWLERPGKGVIHLCRRLTRAEAKRVGGVRDIRETREETARLRSMSKKLKLPYGVLRKAERRSDELRLNEGPDGDTTER